MREFVIKKCKFDHNVLITKIVIYTKNIYKINIFRWERGDIFLFQGFLHGNSWKKKNPKYAIQAILNMNGLKGDVGPSILWDSKVSYSILFFIILRYVVIKKCNFKVKNGVWVAFEPEPELANQLATKSKLNAGICTWYLQRKLRKGRTEQEVMDHSKAKKVKET